jgi:hypothetical protein
MMERTWDVLLVGAVLIPFVLVYACGVMVRIHRENQQTPDNKRPLLSFTQVGETLPGLFETLIFLCALFGGVWDQSTKGTQFQLLGLLCSAGFLAFRGGYTYPESLKSMVQKKSPELTGAH